MAHVTADRVRDTSTTAGTGAFAVSGTAPTGYRTFSAVLSTNDTCWYAIQHQTAAEWEVGLGTYSSANTITRTTVLASSNSGDAVSFSAGTKDVFITLAAGKTVQLDASGNASALGTVASATLTNATGLPISTGVSGLGTGVATFLATPSSANLASAVTDETGSGALVFGTSPSFTTSALFPDGAQSAPSIGHAGDTNTGFYFPAAGTIAASTSGAERLRITSAGNVGIGTTNLSTVSFRVTKNITGSTTAYLSRYDGTVQPDVTGAAYGSTVINGTAANGGTPYTINSLYAYQAAQGTFNADSTVTNQFTFSVNANSIGATNNYGFHIGNTAAVTTGKTSYGFYSGINTAIGGGTTYQLYMAGTATSYINGNLGIGTTSPDAPLTVNTIASFGDGAVGTPSIAHKGDLNTGFWFPAADTIAASTAGLERLRIDSSGNVGIGTSSPAAKLEVKNAGFSAIQVSGDSTSETQLRFATNTAARISQQANQALIFDTNATERMRITSAGDVGIGTSSPTYLLDVQNTSTSADYYAGRYYSAANPSGTSVTHLRLEKGAGYGGTVGGYLTQGVASGLVFSTLSGGTLANAMWINNSGNVGIGTSSPAALLHLEKNLAGEIGEFIYNPNASGYAALRIGNSDRGTNGDHLIYGASVLGLRSKTGAAITFEPAGTERMRIDSSGNVGINTSVAGGFSGTVNLGGSGSPASGYLEGFSNTQSIPSSVTTRFDGFFSVPSTAAASFTVGELNHFRAQGTTKGAGSAVTSQIGFHASSNLTAGTYNFGFFSDIASGAGRYNFYAQGTADNYFAGNVGIGTNSFGTSAVKVLALGNATAPTTGPADTIQIYSTDLSAGNTMLSLYTEGTPVNANTTAAATHRIAIRVNGTVYYLLANTSA